MRIIATFFVLLTVFTIGSVAEEGGYRKSTSRTGGHGGKASANGQAKGNNGDNNGNGGKASANGGHG
ncbi:hypothetical protein CVT26_001483 [Gymnopilus dilepis]|uniref:Uncharacterized protein n=1 Tax=Gymnopilus dilepis TaxID=231916 RepID=A0A409WBD3_9AGAR|nr:hypothetical protein CVT26_001483 [Gymnopilus dilepis]